MCEEMLLWHKQTLLPSSVLPFVPIPHRARRSSRTVCPMFLMNQIETAMAAAPKSDHKALNSENNYAIALLAAPLVLHTTMAFAEEQSAASTAARAAPEWLVPAFLAFPVVSYLIFTVYRDKVNPYAKITDWMFGMAALVILANLILIATIGVRLY